MQCVDDSTVGTIQKFYCVSPAHSNSSPIEVWFSTVRVAMQGSAVQYAALVGGKEMIRCKTALRNNPMYSSSVVGDAEKGKYIGPIELIKYHTDRERKM